MFFCLKFIKRYKPTIKSNVSESSWLHYQGKNVFDYANYSIYSDVDLSLKVNTTIQPVFASRKTEQELNVKEVKPPIVNEQCVVYNF